MPSLLVSAQLNITAASGGTSNSADKAPNAITPASTILTNIEIQEIAPADIGKDVTALVLNAPARRKFNTSGVSVNASGGDINMGTIVYTVISISIHFAVASASMIDLITITNLGVRANVGMSLPNAGNILLFLPEPSII